MVDERDSGRLYGCHLSSFVGLLCTGCSLYNSDYSEKTVRFSRCLFGVISFPCVVDVCYLFPKTKNTVRGLWVPSVDAIVDRSNCFLFFFFISAMCVWSICCVLRVHSLGVAPRCRFYCVVRTDEVPCTDPLPLHAEFLRPVSQVDPYSCMEVRWISMDFESACSIINC